MGKLSYSRKKKEEERKKKERLASIAGSLFSCVSEELGSSLSLSLHEDNVTLH